MHTAELPNKTQQRTHCLFPFANYPVVGKEQQIEPDFEAEYIIMSAPIELVPISARERIQALDVLRGFALFGILLVNIEGIVGPFSGSISGTDLNLSGPSLWTDAATYIFAQGKFYTIFSLLFGMGFAVILSRARAAGRTFGGLYMRRLLALAAMGLAHALLLRAGDILLVYAAFGLLLLPFRNTPQSRLPIYGLLLYVVPVALVLLLGGLCALLMQNPAMAEEMGKSLAQEQEAIQASIVAQRQAYGSGTYADAVRQAVPDMGIMWGYMAFVGWQILGLFLLGAWFIRSGAIARPESYPRLYNMLQWVALPVGTVMMLVSFWLLPTNDLARMDMEVALATALNLVGSLLMSLGYMAWVIRGLESAAWAPKLQMLAPAGRMALTNYLLQSLVCALIFNNYGLGLYEQLSRAWQVPFVILFFALQVALSKWWMNRFHFGPMEWLWRAFTYLKLPKLQKKEEVTLISPVITGE